MMNKLQKLIMHKHLDNNLNLSEINTLDISSMPNIVETHNHHYNVVIHNLQQIKTPKSHTNCLQKSSSFHHQLPHFCLFSYSSIDNTITTNCSLICPKFVSHHNIHSWTLCKKQGTQLDQTPFSFNFKHHLHFSPYNQLCTICPKKGNG
jgi:hypothetical protein